jgi:KDO II ethanolaminephosphotransferase
VFRRQPAPIGTATQAGYGLMLAVSLFVGGALNSVVWWRRVQADFSTLPGHWGWVGPASEAALVISVTTLLLLVASLLGRLAWRLAASSLIAISALCAYFMSQYNVLIGYGVVQAVFTTDHDMSGEVLGMGLLLWWLALGLAPAWWIWRRPAPPSLWHLVRSRGQFLASFAAVLLLAVVVFAAGRAGLKQVAPMVRGSDTELVANLAGIAAHSYVPSNWISATAMVASNRLALGSGIQRKTSPAERFTYTVPAGLEDVVVVVVIGETARHDHFGMLGYGRDTTPRMGALEGVVGFRATSCDTSTKLSIACMFVRPEGITEGDGLSPDTINEETVFSVFKSLGFSIELHALQSEVGLYQLMKPDRYAIREMIFADPRHAKAVKNDLLLVDELEADLKRHPTGRHVSILHIKGSHFSYTQRYPREFAQWQPECSGVNSRCSKGELINSFDNSIRFTDHVLAEVAAQLKGRKALLVYSSDHGESIDDNAHFHATPRKLAPPEQRRVPLLFWATPELRAHPAVLLGWQALQQAARRDADGATSHANLFASLLGCLGIRSPDGGLTATRNLCHR